ncbi:MAG TPA: hypothetical protein VFY37_04130 [Solirubrobacterales bacterium]|nr:hypothetical protein [Solirubrobacterales bacterium]
MDQLVDGVQVARVEEVVHHAPCDLDVAVSIGHLRLLIQSVRDLII